MLFSNDQVALFINRNFEATWEMVREVPIIRIDFGHGNVLTRTLHGNILTSVCTAEGKTLDALPGIYNPQGYLDQLDQFRLLAQNFLKVPADAREQWVRQYHVNAVAAIQGKQPRAQFIETKPVGPIPKSRIERPTELMLAMQRAAAIKAALPPPPVVPPIARLPIGKGIVEFPTQNLLAQGRYGQPGPLGLPPNGPPIQVAPVLVETPVAPPLTGNPDELAGWKALAEDTQLNETTRRRQIHELLAKEGLVLPAQILKPIYKDVLHADLDDPYLGLGMTLFENYPFAKEDAKP